MQNTINNVSFQANLKPLTKIKNKSAFVEAKDIFRDATRNYPNDNIYITRNTVGETIINLHKDMSNNFYSNKNIGTKNIDTQINEMGVNKFAEKLVKMFKALKLYELTTLKLTDLKAEMYRLSNIMLINKNAARSWYSEGRHTIADRYNILAKNNQGKIDKLKSEEQKLKDEFNKRIEDLSNQYKELIQLKIK